MMLQLPPPLVNRVHCMDVLDYLRIVPANSVNCCVTSPPYFGLRDYGVTGQIGLEQTPREYVDKLVRVFREVRRVLREDGTCWLNLGDSYSNDDKWGGATGGKHANDLHGQTGVGREKKATGLPPKSLMMIPARVAIALQDDGWIVRSEIVWAKPNPMPESVTDRPTKAHEMIYLLTKSPRYWYDNEAIKETAVDGDPTSPRGSKGVMGQQNKDNRKQDMTGNRRYTGFNARWDAREPLELRNKRSVWTVPTQPVSYAHFACFPEKLIEPMILAGCPKDGIVLDIFMGSGTTAAVAERLGRRWQGCELNKEYIEIIKRRLEERGGALEHLPMFAEVATP